MHSAGAAVHQVPLGPNTGSLVGSGGGTWTAKAFEEFVQSWRGGSKIIWF